MMTAHKREKEKSAYNIDIISCTRDREIFAVVGEAQV
jgi:hypothetical protein